MQRGGIGAVLSVNTGTLCEPEVFAAADIAPADAGKIKKGSVDVEKGQTVTIHLVPKAGQYDLKCSHFGHATFGMTGVIVVR